MYADKLSLDGLEQFIASASFDPPLYTWAVASHHIFYYQQFSNFVKI